MEKLLENFVRCI